jgi:hypothetical protein
MNESSILASLLKTQDIKLSEFLEKLAAQKIDVDTTQMKQLITQYNNLLNNAANIKPNIDTSNVKSTVLNAIDDAVSSSRLSDLQYEVTRQTEAVNKNSTLLQIGFGNMFKWWILSLILIFGVFIGWTINLCFSIPEKLTQTQEMQRKMAIYDEIFLQTDIYTKFVNSNQQIKTEFIKFTKAKLNPNEAIQSQIRFIKDNLNNQNK